MLEELLPRLLTPTARIPGPVIDLDHPVRRSTSRRQLLDATLVGPGRVDPSIVHDGIWEAMGPAHPPRTLAQLSNVVPPTPWLYEAAWRVRSLSLLSGRKFPVTEELAELDQAVGDVTGAVCVDIGCSEGLYARHLAGRGALVLAIDHSRPFLRRAQHRAERAGVAIAPVRATAQRLPIGDAMADVAVIGGSLNEIGDRRAALAEAGRVVRPGGIMFVMSLVAATTKNGRRLQRALGASGIEFPTGDGTFDEFAAAGFRVVEHRLDRVVLRTTAIRTD